MDKITNRRSVLIGTAGAIASIGAATGVSSADRGDWDPDLNIGRHRMWAQIKTDDFDEITVGFEDGHTETWTNSGQFGRYEAFGYIWEDNEEGWVSGWYGPIEYIEATRGDSTMRYTYTGTEDVPEIECGIVSGYDATDLRVSLENSYKMYDGPMGDNRTYGSPGQSIESIEEIGIYYIEPDQNCDSGDKAVEFGCTEVTVYPEEFVNGHKEMWNVRLEFADGSEEQKGREEMFEPPETFRGTGENEGKIIERIRIWNDSGGEAMFNYSNPDVDSCEPEEEDPDPEEETEEPEQEEEDPEEPEEQETEEEEETEQPQETEKEEDEEDPGDEEETEETETESDSEQTDEETGTEDEESEEETEDGEKNDQRSIGPGDVDDEEEGLDDDDSNQTSGTVNDTDNESNSNTESSVGGIIIRILRRIQNLF